eukprot:TRINITY_DN7083_c1_g1_i1.p2 TRINITY_DN7083_c1_g1~~TRINITY_DN7083_c1_g1_i1.p2  ORF type:complete len:417 (-),score=62.90 TRINITY_DN7083_c1_g1_i1:382-1632(-)
MGGSHRRKQQRQQLNIITGETTDLQQQYSAVKDLDHQDSGLSNNPFVALPLITLKAKIFARLSARSLCCLAAVDKYFKDTTASDDVWRRICAIKGWDEIIDSSEGWKQGFLEYHKSVCVECERKTNYVFALLNCRLCEKCEHQNPRYALATLAEARDGYGLSNAELRGMPYLERYNTLLFVRSQVAQRATELGKSLSTDAKARNMHVKTPLQKERFEAEASLHGHSEYESEEDWEDDEDEGEENVRGEENDLTFAIDDLGGPSGSNQTDHRQLLAAQKVRAKKEADKAARKAHKKQVKQQNREKRAAKKENGGKFGSSPKMGASPPGESPPGGHPSLHVPQSNKGSRRHNSYKYSKQVWKEARRHAGHAKEFQTNRTDTLGASPSQARSYWLFERERILQEWGLFDLSGLILSTVE